VAEIACVIEIEKEHFRALFTLAYSISNANFDSTRYQRVTAPPRQSMKSKKAQKPFWLYDGSPDLAELIVDAATLTEGGYVIVIELTSGLTRLAATRHPGKYVTAWHQFVKRYGLPDISRMIISHPHLRYEAIKRGIAKSLAEYRDEELDVYRLPVDAVTKNAESVIEMLEGISGPGQVKKLAGKAK